MEEDKMKVVVREFDAERDAAGAEAVERMCDVGASGSGSISLFTDLLGDPLSRVRHSPAHLMLVAETTAPEEAKIVGIIRGCVKKVTCGKKTQPGGKQREQATPVALCTKAAYILGLRVSPNHRRQGIGLKLVTRLEQWFSDMGVEYSYMATEKDNEASVGLFTRRCGYSKFRTPSILVQPVFVHSLPTPRHVTITKLNADDAESLYRRRFSTIEFFPSDIDAILGNPLCLGTFLAVSGHDRNDGEARDDNPDSWAVMSVWNCKEVFRLEVRGASKLKRGLAKATRVIDRAFPWLRIPSVPNLFRPFGLHFLFGIGGDGPRAVELVSALCSHAHNMAREGGCGVMATEVASCDPIRAGIPHWKMMSCEEDLWCIKRLAEDYSDGAIGDWTKSPPDTSIFVDPREF